MGKNKRAYFDILYLLLSILAERMSGIRATKLIVACNLCSRSYGEMMRDLIKYSLITVEKQDHQTTIRLTARGMQLYKLLGEAKNDC
jgi:predicted transcriptional regulator